MEEIFITKDFEETQNLGQKFAGKLKAGDIICLYGELGAGKTTFVQGLAKGLGISQRIISPTFIIVRKYDDFYHVDLYRVESEKDIEGLGLEEILNSKDSIVALEWAEKLGNLLPKKRIDIYFEYLDDEKRKIIIGSATPSLDRAIEILKDGGIVIFPTDTAFGIGCRMDDEKAVERLFKIRKRPKEQATSVLVSGVEMARQYVLEIPKEVEEKLIKKYWPGALTIILNANIDKVPKMVRGGGKTLGVRMPDNETALRLIKGVGVPILGPSANFSGFPTPYSFADLDKDLVKLVDCVVWGETEFREASTVIDCTVKPWKILREGPVKVSI